MEDNSPSRGIIIVLSAGVSGVVVVLIAAAVIVISVTVCLRKRNNKHVNVSDNVAYGVSRNEIELSACDDVANQPNSRQLKMKNNTETRASDSDDVYAYTTPPTTAILTSNAAYNVLMLCMTSPLPLEIEKQNLIFLPLHMMLLVKQENMKWLYTYTSFEVSLWNVTLGETVDSMDMY